jgi:hypothetical protein
MRALARKLGFQGRARSADARLVRLSRLVRAEDARGATQGPARAGWRELLRMLRVLPAAAG